MRDPMTWDKGPLFIQNDRWENVLKAIDQNLCNNFITHSIEADRSKLCWEVHILDFGDQNHKSFLPPLLHIAGHEEFLYSINDRPTHNVLKVLVKRGSNPINSRSPI